jgi:WD40 repeat protein
LRELDVSKAPITHLSLSPDGKTAAISSSDLTVRLWDVTAKRIITLPDCTSACFSPVDPTLAVATRSGTIELRDPATGAVQKRLRGHTEPPEALSFSADGKLILSLSKDGSVRLWDASRGYLRAVLRGTPSPACCITLSADGKLAAAGSEDGKLLLWDLSRLTDS